MKELTLPATLENLDRVLAFVDAELAAAGCPMDVQFQIDIAVEEIYVNIAHYAYAPAAGEATILCGVTAEPAEATIELRDSGTPYNPLAREDPDITLSAEERAVGGLGIYMVKNSMDAVTYEHRAGQNILTIRKRLRRA